MAKRGAGNDLNDRNWDDDEEPEEAGVFAQATKDVLEHRMIKKAKRRVAGDETGAKPSAFSGFSGFGDKKTTSSVDTFSGFKKLDSDKVPSGKTSFFAGTSSVNGDEDQKLKGQGNNKDSSSYLSCLKSLNESVLAWIKQHVDSNPYIILTPVFKDYEKYLDMIKTEKAVGKEDSNDNQNTDCMASASSKVTRSTIAVLASKPDDDKGKPSEAAKSKPFTFGQTTTEPAKPFTFGQTTVEPSKPFTFGQTTTESSKPDTIGQTTAEPSKPFTFGQTAVESSISEGFSFAASSGSTPGSTVKFTSASSTPGAGFFFSQTSSGPSSLFGKTTLTSSGSTGASQGMFSFGKTASQESSSTESVHEGADKDEDYVPPKPEVKDVIEADALYSIRCKLYTQKQGQWVDRGVGNLHLKPVADNKTQLLVRADTNLGNVLLNIMLSSSLPASRQGKNNVVLVCVANPPLPNADDPDAPIPMLVRVKTGEDADELLAKIDERKKLL